MRGDGGVHLDELHHGGDFNVGEAVKGGHFAGEVLIKRAVVWADQCCDQVGGSGGGGDKGKFGAAGQGLSDVFQICGGHRHPQQGLRADPKGVADEVQVEEAAEALSGWGEASGSNFHAVGRRLVADARAPASPGRFWGFGRSTLKEDLCRKDPRLMAKRQFGTVRRLRSGRWQVRYRDSSGERLMAHGTFATKGDASRFLATVQADMARGQYIDPRAQRLTLHAWAEEWLNRAGKKAASRTRDRQALAAFMPALGGLALPAVTASRVQAAVDARARAVGPATVVRDFAPLRAMLNAAVDADLLARSPARRIALPKVRPPERRTLAPKDLLALVEEVPSHYRALVLTAGVLGLRWGEAVALRVRDVDFERATVTVAQVIEELAGQLRVVPEAKSPASLRTMAVPAFLLDALVRHLKDHRGDALGDPNSLLFVGPRGGVLRRRFGERILRPAVARAGLPGLTFHGLRHAAVSALVDEGVHPRVMAARAGHGTAKLTMELYAHVSDSADREAATLLQKRFAELFSPPTRSVWDPRQDSQEPASASDPDGANP